MNMATEGSTVLIGTTSETCPTSTEIANAMENSNVEVTTGNSEITEVSSEASSTVTLVAQEDQETSDTFILRFSTACSPFRLPEHAEIGLAAIEKFEDPMLTCTHRTEGAEIVYKIELTKQVPKYGNSLTFIIEGNTSIDNSNVFILQLLFTH